MRTRIFTMILLFFACYGLHAKEITVTTSTIASEYAGAGDGDVLLLETGSYATSLAFPSGKTITLKAATGATPVFTGTFSGDANTSNGGIIFDGVDIDRNNSYVFNFSLGDAKIFAFRNLTISNVQRCLIWTNNTGYFIDKIEFDNCIIKECGTGRYNLIYTKHGVKNVHVKNSTLYNYNAGESFFCVYDDSKTNVLNFVFENNTVYNWSGATDGRAFAKVDSRYSDASTYTFRNNIVAEHTGNFLPRMCDIGGGTVVGEKNLIVNYGGYKGGTQTINDVTLADLELTSIGFVNPLEGDFTIVATSPIATAGVGGVCLGDPRWVKLIAEPTQLSTLVYPVGAGAATPGSAIYAKGETVTVSATHNYGYRFKEWQNKGQKVSAENPYTFELTEETELTAVFNTLDTYTLTVNKDGEGAAWGRYTLNPEPVNGVYEEGESVMVKIVPNDITSFLYWDDQTNETSRMVSMDGNKTLTATFEWVPFIVAWDFDPSEPRSARIADYYSRSDNQGLMKFFKSGAEIEKDPSNPNTNWGGSTKSFGGITYTCARRYTAAAELDDPRYFQAEFSAKGYEQVKYKNIRVSSYISIDNVCSHKVQKIQYATSAEGPFVDLASVDMTPYYNSQWVELSGTLPETLTEEEKTRIYIRWIGDTSSELLGTPASGDTEGFYLANVVVFVELDEEPDPIPPVLLSTTPVENSSNAYTSGSIVLTFDERVKAGENEGKIVFNGETLTPVFANRTVSYPYRNLSYGTQYSVVIPEGIITDMSGNEYEGTTFIFSTRNRPEPVARIFDAVVDVDGTGDYFSIQAAIDGAPSNRNAPWLIFVKNGRYSGLVRVPSDKPFIHLIGEDRDHVIIEHKIHCGDASDPLSSSAQGVSDCSAVVISAPDFYAENISFENAYGVQAQDGPQALAIFTNEDHISFNNCKFRSFQDTWLTSKKRDTDRAYVNNTWIEGAVDYIYGGSDIYVENSDIYFVRSGYLVAPAHKEETTLWGYVFNNCTIDAKEGVTSYSLGRPWHNQPMAVFLNTTMKVLPMAEGWSEWGAIPKLFAEYNSMYPNGDPVDLGSRRTIYNGETRQAVLSREEAAEYTYENVIYKRDSWDPKSYFELVSKPANITMSEGNVLSWNACSYAICYAVYKDGRVMDFTTSTSFLDAEATADNKYAVRPVNEYGSLGEMSKEVSKTPTSIGYVELPEDKISFEKEADRLIIKNVKPGMLIRMFTTDGRLVKNLKSSADQVIIPVSSFKGIYIIKAGESSFKVVL